MTHDPEFFSAMVMFWATSPLPYFHRFLVSVTFQPDWRPG